MILLAYGFVIPFRLYVSQTDILFNELFVEPVHGARGRLPVPANAYGFLQKRQVDPGGLQHFAGVKRV
jgi:hypothetical protein